MRRIDLRPHLDSRSEASGLSRGLRAAGTCHEAVVTSHCNVRLFACRQAQSSLIHFHDAVETLGSLGSSSHDEHGASLVCILPQRIQNADSIIDVQIAGRFVGQQQLRFAEGILRAMRTNRGRRSLLASGAINPSSAATTVHELKGQFAIAVPIAHPRATPKNGSRSAQDVPSENLLGTPDKRTGRTAPLR